MDCEGDIELGDNFVAKIEKGPARCRNCLRVKHRIDARTDPEKDRQEDRGLEQAGFLLDSKSNWDVEAEQGRAHIGQGTPLPVKHPFVSSTLPGPSDALSFESAPVSIFSQNLDPGRLLAPQDGPVSITAEFNVYPTKRRSRLSRRPYPFAPCVARADCEKVLFCPFVCIPSNGEVCGERGHNPASGALNWETRRCLVFWY